VKEHSDIADNKHADKFADSAASSDLVLLVLVKKMFIKAGGVAVSDNVRYFAQDEAGPSSAVISKDMIGDIDWVHTASV
ncbi:hypothetical protein G9A89_004157, partial [Geosiphon pyriformis]